MIRRCLRQVNSTWMPREESSLGKSQQMANLPALAPTPSSQELLFPVWEPTLSLGRQQGQYFIFQSCLPACKQRPRCLFYACLIRKIFGVWRGETDPHFWIDPRDLVQQVCEAQTSRFGFVDCAKATAEAWGSHRLKLHLRQVSKAVDILTQEGHFFHSLQNKQEKKCNSGRMAELQGQPWFYSKEFATEALPSLSVMEYYKGNESHWWNPTVTSALQIKAVTLVTSTTENTVTRNHPWFGTGGRRLCLT